MNTRLRCRILGACAVVLLAARVYAAPTPTPVAASATSYAPVASVEPFPVLHRRLTDAKSGVMQSHLAFLAERYDLADPPAAGVTMSRGKPVQQGPRARLAAGMTWEKPGARRARKCAGSMYSPAASGRCRIHNMPKAACCSRP